MANLGHLPLDTKIYLSNKELVDIKKIKIGDEILSLKLKGSENKTKFDFLCDFLNKDLSNIEDGFELSKTYVTSVGTVKGEINFLLFNECLIYKDQPVLIYQNSTPKIIVANEIIDLIKQDRYILKTRFNYENESNIFIKEKIENSINTEIQRSSFYLNTLNNDLFFTEHYVIFGGNV